MASKATAQGGIAAEGPCKLFTFIVSDLQGLFCGKKGICCMSELLEKPETKDVFYLSAYSRTDGLARRVRVNGLNFLLDLTAPLKNGDTVFVADNARNLYIGTITGEGEDGLGDGIVVRVSEPEYSGRPPKILELVRGSEMLFDHRFPMRVRAVEILEGR